MWRILVLFMEKQNSSAVMGKQWYILIKSCVELLCDMAITFLGLYPEELKARTQTNVCSPMTMAALLTIARYRWGNRCGIHTQGNISQPY